MGAVPRGAVLTTTSARASSPPGSRGSADPSRPAWCRRRATSWELPRFPWPPPQAQRSGLPPCLSSPGHLMLRATPAPPGAGFCLTISPAARHPPFARPPGFPRTGPGRAGARRSPKANSYHLRPRRRAEDVARASRPPSHRPEGPGKMGGQGERLRRRAGARTGVERGPLDLRERNRGTGHRPVGCRGSPQRGRRCLPAPHIVCLVSRGLLLGAISDRGARAGDRPRDGVYEFFFVSQPTPIPRAVGSPIHPLAIP